MAFTHSFLYPSSHQRNFGPGQDGYHSTTSLLPSAFLSCSFLEVRLGFLRPLVCADHSFIPASSVLSLSIWTSEASDEFLTGVGRICKGFLEEAELPFGRWNRGRAEAMEELLARKESKYLEKWSGKAGPWQVTSPWASASSFLKVSAALLGDAHSSG